MTLHLVSAPAPISRNESGNIDRAAMIKRMAEHLVAAILHDRLDTSSDQDVIACLYDAPDRYHHRLVLDSYLDAIFEAKQILVAAEIRK